MIIEVSDIILVVVMLVFSALFSGIETAFMTANRLKIELKSAQGDAVGNLLSGFVRQTPKVLSTILVGNTVSLVLYGIAMGRLSGSITTGMHWIDPLRQPYLMLAVEASVATLEQVGAWMRKNGESVHGAKASPFPEFPWGRCTVKGNILYLHVPRRLLQF